MGESSEKNWEGHCPTNRVRVCECDPALHAPPQHFRFGFFSTHHFTFNHFAFLSSEYIVFVEPAPLSVWNVICIDLFFYSPPVLTGPYAMHYVRACMRAPTHGTPQAGRHIA